MKGLLRIQELGKLSVMGQQYKKGCVWSLVTGESRLSSRGGGAWNNLQARV